MTTLRDALGRFSRPHLSRAGRRLMNDRSYTRRRRLRPRVWSWWRDQRCPF